MAGGQERILRRRIRSVQSTRKITKAMELIAASRIVRAQARIAANRPFRDGMERVLRETAAADSQAAAKLLGTPESPRHVGLLTIAGDRGLAGSYNSGSLRMTERLINEHREAGAQVTLWAVGKKAPSYFRYRGIEVQQSFVGIADRPEFSDARHIAAVVAAPFVSGEIDLVQMVSTRFISAGIQRVEPTQLLPGRRALLWRATPSSSPSPRGCSSNWRPARWRRRSSPRCSRVRPPSTRPSSGPWPPPPRTRTSSSAR